jgi:site-specific DNA recombinase
LDRIARNLKDLLQTVDELKGYGCALVVKKEHFDTSTAQGVFVLQMLGAVGELERSMISERVQSGRVENAKQGGYNGSRIPYGYIYSGEQFTIVHEQAQWVREIFDGFLAGHSLNSIASALNFNGAPTATGGKWYASTIRYILTNGLYAGLAQWYADGDKEDSKIVVPDTYPAIITREAYEAAHKRLQALRPGKQLESEIEKRLANPSLYV